MNRSNTEKSNEINNQSNSFLLNNDIDNVKEQNFITQLNKNKTNDSNNKHNIKIENSSKNIQKKTKVKLHSNSRSSSCFTKNNSSTQTIQQHLLSHKNLKKKIENQNLLFSSKFEDQINKSDFHDENHSKIIKKPNTYKKKFIKKSSKKRLSLSKDNYNYSDLIRTTKSLKTPKYIKNITPQSTNKKKNSNSSISHTSKTIQ